MAFSIFHKNPATLIVLTQELGQDGQRAEGASIAVEWWLEKTQVGEMEQTEKQDVTIRLLPLPQHFW